MSRLTRYVSIVSACLSFAGAAHAGAVGDFEASLRGAYTDYRSALFQTNSNNGEQATKAIAAFRQEWSDLTSANAEPPPQYADDPAYGETLASVAAIADTAAAQIAEGKLGEAHITLEAIREEVSGLHERNGIIAFADRMNAYHAKMEEILTRDYSAAPVGQMDQMKATEPGGFSQEGLGELREDAAVLAYLADHVAAHPPAESSDPAFKPLLDGMMASVAALTKAARDADPAAAKKAVDGLKMPYAKLFLKFG